MYDRWRHNLGKEGNQDSGNFFFRFFNKIKTLNAHKLTTVTDILATPILPLVRMQLPHGEGHIHGGHRSGTLMMTAVMVRSYVASSATSRNQVQPRDTQLASAAYLFLVFSI